MEITGVLKEAQVLPLALNSIMDWTQIALLI
jgi:hypothetical protein